MTAAPMALLMLAPTVAPVPASVAQAPAPAAEELAVLALEAQRMQQRVAGDNAAVRAAFLDDAVYIHGNGNQQSVDQYAAELGGGRWLAVDISRQSARIYGDTAVTHALMAIKISPTYSSTVRTTGVYLRRDGRWRLVSWQSTPVATRTP